MFFAPPAPPPAELCISSAEIVREWIERIAVPETVTPAGQADLSF
jgi:hypothetical protein